MKPGRRTRAAGRRRRWLNAAVELFVRGSALFSGAAILAILGFLAYCASPLVWGSGVEAIFTWEWNPSLRLYGILPMVAGTFFLSVAALLVAFPAAVGVCLFTHGVGPPRLGRYLLTVVTIMTGVPTVVYAFVSAILLVPFLREVSGNSVSGYSLLAATVTLAVLILPTIVLLIDAWWRGMGGRVELTGAALGLTKAQVTLWVLLPHSARALAVAAIMGFGRAVGDTMIALMVAGNAAQLPGSPFDSIRTLTAHIALMSEVDTQSLLYHSMFACALILLVLTAALNLAARRLGGLIGRTRYGATTYR